MRGWTRRENLLMGGVGFGASALILYPLVLLFWGSFRVEEWGRASYYTAANYLHAFTDPTIRHALGNTGIIGVGSTAVAALLGITLAWLVARSDMPLRGALEPLNLIPLFLSPFVGAIGWAYLAAPRAGLLNKLAALWFGGGGEALNIYSRAGIVWVLGLFFTPFIYLMTVGSLRRMDPALEESARACGAGILRTTALVTLPLVAPGLLSGILLTFVLSAGEFGVPLALGAPRNIETLPTQIFEVLQRTQPNYNLAAAIASLLLLATVLCVLVQRRVILPRQFITVTGKGYRPARVALGPWRYAALAFNLGYVLVGVLLPIVALAIVSLHKFWTGNISLRLLTLSHYAHVLFVEQVSATGLKNSLVLATAGATLSMLVSTIIAYGIFRSRLPGRRLMDFVTSIPVGVPGVVLAMGFLLAFIRTPLYGTLGILLLAYMLRFLPFGQRSVSSVLLSLSPELDESARIAGATWGRTVREVTAPLLKPGLVAGWLLLFIIFVRELPISILLWSSGNEVLSVALWQLLEHRPVGQTAAFAVIQTGIILAVVVLMKVTVGMGEMEAQG